MLGWRGRSKDQNQRIQKERAEELHDLKEENIKETSDCSRNKISLLKKRGRKQGGSCPSQKKKKTSQKPHGKMLLKPGKIN